MDTVTYSMFKLLARASHTHMKNELTSNVKTKVAEHLLPVYENSPKIDLNFGVVSWIGISYVSSFLVMYECCYIPTELLSLISYALLGN